MRFVIFDDGNLVSSFHDETEAVDVLRELATNTAAEPHLLLAAFDDDGELVADCVPGEQLVIPA
jgi:hypothetical protein